MELYILTSGIIVIILILFFSISYKYICITTLNCDTKIKGNMKTKIKCCGYESIINFSYYRKNRHKAVFMVHDIHGEISKINNGIASNKNVIYRYIASYNCDTNNLCITLLDTQGNVACLQGYNQIKIILCNKQKCMDGKNENYSHPQDNKNGMCR